MKQKKTMKQNKIKKEKENEKYVIEMIDPCTGCAFETKNGSTIYDEVEGGQRILKYSSIRVSVCSVLTHPKWGSFIYPTTIFTNANLKCIKQYIQALKSDFKFNP